jgi:predicted RNA methylase
MPETLDVGEGDPAVHGPTKESATNWDAPFLWASKLAKSPTEAARLANLAIANELSAIRLENSRSPYEIKSWRESVIARALSKPVVTKSYLDLWEQLHGAAASAAASIKDASGIDKWVEAFQTFDPHRKTRGAYATPLPLAETLARSALQTKTARRILDPAAGTGSLLLAVQRLLLADVSSQEDRKERTLRLYGTEIDPNARELACLLLWIGSYGAASLEEIATHVVIDNALTKNWREEDPFDVVIMNPPWESLRHARSDIVLDSQRNATLDRLRLAAPGANLLPPLFTRQGKGDHNLYKMFVELAPHLLNMHGRLAALIPAAFASDLGMSQLRELYFSEMRIERWTSFENLSGYFSIDSRYKFAIMQAGRDRSGTDTLEIRSFASVASEAEAPHIVISRPERMRLGGPTGMIPEVSSRRELEVFERTLEHGTPLLGAGTTFGHVSYRREIDLTLDRKRGRFIRLDECNLGHISTDGIYTVRREQQTKPLVPLIEGRMISHYDFFAKSWIAGSGRTAQWKYTNGNHLQDCRPQFLIEPLEEPDWVRVALCDVTSATNTRTVMAALVPGTWTCGNTAPTLRFESTRLALAATAVLNSMVFDWLARRVVSGLHLNKFYLNSLVWPGLTDELIDTLAERSRALTLANPRFIGLAERNNPAVVGNKAATEDYVDSHVIIERIVAQGFGLTKSMIQEVLSEQPTDRRGLWRHFASDPHAKAVKTALIERCKPDVGALSHLGQSVGV